MFGIRWSTEVTIKFKRTFALYRISTWLDFGHLQGNAIQGTDRNSFLPNQSSQRFRTVSSSLVWGRSKSPWRWKSVAWVLSCLITGMSRYSRALSQWRNLTTFNSEQQWLDMVVGDNFLWSCKNEKKHYTIYQDSRHSTKQSITIINTSPKYHLLELTFWTSFRKTNSAVKDMNSYIT